jgi:hypothetical protein
MRDMDGEEPAGAGVARVAVEVPLANLDRPFDYRVTEAQAEAAVVGARVRVRFAGKLRGGFIVERPATSEGSPTTTRAASWTWCGSQSRPGTGSPSGPPRRTTPRPT